MDLESPSFSVSVLVTCLLVVVRFSKGGDISCPCPPIPQVNLTKHPPRNCSQVGGHFRYECKAGYLRKAGTSNLIKCKKSDSTVQWTPLSLKCIPDPTRTTTEAPNPTLTTPASTSLQMTQSISTSVAARHRTGPTSPGPLVTSDYSQDGTTATEATDGQTITTTEPSQNSTIDLHVSDRELHTSIRAASTIVPLVIICALIGISYWCYKRRSNRSPQIEKTEEALQFISSGVVQFREAA